MQKGEKVSVASEQIDTERQTANVQYVTEEQQVVEYGRSPMQVLETDFEIEEEDIFSGLVSVGYGLRNNLDALMDFEMATSKGSVLGLDGYMEGWNTELDDDWRSKMFNSNAALSFMHSFERVALAFNADYGYRRYNLRKGKQFDYYANGLNRFNRIINEGSFYTSIFSTGASQLDYNLQVGYQGLKADRLILNDRNQDYKENILRVYGNLTLPLKSGVLGVYYNQKSVINDKYSTMTLTPSWNWSNEKVYLSLGANVDLRTSKEDRILASPMIVINQNLKTTKNADFMLLTEITGGVMDNNMRSLWSVSPYWTSKNKIKDGYTLIDFYSGVSMSLTDKVTFVIGNGYSYTKNAIFQTLSDSIIVSSMLEQHNSGLFYNKLTRSEEHMSELQSR